MSRNLLVIGGGVVGLTAAWWLLEAGHRVTLLERNDVGGGASHSNGGQLSYRYVAPLADAGVPLKALAWLRQPDGPLRFKPEASPHQWRWLLTFLGRCNAATHRRTTGQLLQLGELSRIAMGQLAQLMPPGEFCLRQPGKLVFYRTPKVFQAAVRQSDSIPQDPTAPAQRVLTAIGALSHEPALAALEADMAGAILTEGEAVADCRAFCQSLEGLLQLHPRFQGLVHGAARRLVGNGGRISGVQTDHGLIEAGDYVLAAGIQSRLLAASVGLRLPLYPLKGYSLTAPIRPGDRPPTLSVTDVERKVLYARIGDHLRVAAMVDLVGEDARIDQGRIDSLLRLAAQAMPHAADYQHSVPWAGLRPATPGGAPIVGPTRYRNLWLDTGHGALGFTFACGTASLLAGMMSGRDAPFALDFLTPASHAAAGGCLS